jgi:hypothetical protein
VYRVATFPLSFPFSLPRESPADETRRQAAQRLFAVRVCTLIADARFHGNLQNPHSEESLCYKKKKKCTLALASVFVR